MNNPCYGDPAVWRKNIGHIPMSGDNVVSIYVDDKVTIYSDCADDYYSGKTVLTVDEVRRIAKALNAYLGTVKGEDE